MRGQRQQTRLFFGLGLGHGAAIIAGPGSLMGHLAAPQQRLPIAFGQRDEGSAAPERIARTRRPAGVEWKALRLASSRAS